MSEQEEIRLFERIRENIRQAQRKLFERKAKLGEDIVVADENGRPVTLKAEVFLKRECK
ncbi:MAG: hypothetical protein J6C91_03415 [Muribaculaceae bacterium]|nr:hypothetical protein [Muribaculaceae bacterium]